MLSIIIGTIFVVLSLGIFFFRMPAELQSVKKIATVATMLLGVTIAASGAVAYNDAGFCQHIRTVFGTETHTCDTGWYFVGWGRSEAWPHEITVAHTVDATGENVLTAFQGSIMPPYRVRLSDNWVGDVTQTTRFAIPRDTEQFITMARRFRTAERLISTTLRPAVTASLDSVANMFSMEEYYAGGKRDQFKSEFKDAVEKGRARVRQISMNQGGFDISRVAPSNSDVAQDTSDVGDTEVRKVIVEKITDENGNVSRVLHDYNEHGITVSSAILENLDPDDAFEQQIQARKEAASRRIVAREQRLEQEEQRLLAIQEGETNIAKRQAAAKVEQIQQTTNAETDKKLALIAAERQRDEAAIARQTSEVNLEKARIDAEAVKVTADAQAYERERLLEADNALALKLDAEIQIQRVWADAYSRRNVPTIVMGSGGDGVPVGSDNEVQNLLQLLTAQTAKNLAYDRVLTDETANGAR